MSKLEQYISKKLPVGFYQWMMFIFFNVQNIATGSILFLINVMPFIIQQDQLFSDDQVKNIIMFFNIGMFICGIGIGYMLDWMGRSPTVKLNLILCLSVFLFFLYEIDYNKLLAISFFFGLYVAFGISAYPTFISEVLPIEARDIGILILSSFLSVGRFVGALVSALFLSPYQYDKWKEVFLFTGIIITIGFTPILFLMKESVKFLYSKKDFKGLFQTWSEIQKMNNQDPASAITHSDIRELEMDQIQQEDLASNSENGPSLWNSEYLYLTIATVLNFGIFLMQSSGHVMMLPKFIGIDSKGLLTNLFIISGELVANVICILIIKNPNVGTKRIMLFSGFSNIVLFFVGSIVSKQYLFILMFLIRIFIKSFLASWTVHTLGVFPTLLKGKAMAISSAFAGFSNIIFPMIFNRLFSIQPVYVMYFMSGSSLISFLLTFFIKRDRKKTIEEYVPV